MIRKRMLSKTLAGALCLGFALFLLPLSACTRQEGRPISEAAVMSFKVGTTTEKDVLQKLGPPEKKEQVLGNAMWIYQHIFTKGWFTVHKSVHEVRLRFDQRGVLQSIEQTKHHGSSLF